MLFCTPYYLLQCRYIFWGWFSVEGRRVCYRIVSWMIVRGEFFLQYFLGEKHDSQSLLHDFSYSQQHRFKLSFIQEYNSYFCKFPFPLHSPQWFFGHIVKTTDGVLYFQHWWGTFRYPISKQMRRNHFWNWCLFWNILLYFLGLPLISFLLNICR